MAAYRRLSATLRDRSEALATLVTLEMGKTIAAARGEVEKCAATLDWIADNGPAILADEPVAVDGGNQVHVSGSAFALQDAYEAAGFPKGLFANLVADNDNDTVAGAIADSRIRRLARHGGVRRRDVRASPAITVADNAGHAITLANTSDYGLGGSLWTSDAQRARRIARRLETGGVFINGYPASNARIPVGGVKRSGNGRELSHFGLRKFTNAQAVWAKVVG